MNSLVREVMGRVFLAIVFLIGSACTVSINSGTTSPIATVTPSRNTATSPSQRPTQSGVLAVVSGPGNTLSLVASDGTVFAATTYDPAPFRPQALMSWTSASLTRVYFLNAGSEVRFLQPNGVGGTATRILVGSSEQAGFAVSPDDTRIAVSVLAYTPVPANTQGVAQPAYKGMRMYVEDLQGGGHHVDIFSSPTLAEFPIGWTAGHIVVAVTTPMCCQALPLNPYAASSYHVVNPDNGDRLTSLCDNTYGPSGPVETVGTMCLEHQDGPSFKRWDGSPFPPPSAVQVSYQYLNALSPDGTRAATGGNPIQILTNLDDHLPVSGYVFGWLDANHLVFQEQGAATVSVFDLASRSGTDLSGSVYLGTLPAAIS